MDCWDQLDRMYTKIEGVGPSPHGTLTCYKNFQRERERKEVIEKTFKHESVSQKLREVDAAETSEW